MTVRIVDKCQIDNVYGKGEIRIIKSEHIGKSATFLAYVIHLIEGDKITILQRDLKSLAEARVTSDTVYGTNFGGKHLNASMSKEGTKPRADYQQFTGTSRSVGKK